MPDFVPPYKPSWVDRLIDWIDGLPVPAPVFYLGVYVVAALAAHAAAWIDGSVPVGQLGAVWVVNPVWVVLSLVWIHYLERVAARSLDKFAAVVPAKPVEYAALRYRMLAMPARPVLVMTGIAAVVVASGAFSDPVGVLNVQDALAQLLVAPFLAFSYSLTPVVFYFTIRLLLSVTRAYDLVDEVNVLHQRPLFAFSNLTMQSGLLWLFIVNLNLVSIVFVEGTEGGTRVVDYSFSALGVVVAFASFLLPLRGIHRRLVDEKSRLIEENAAVVDRTRENLYAALDGRSHEEVESLDRGLTSLFRLRDELEAIPTWPWRPGTFRTFLSAVVLPLLVWVAQQLLQRFGV